MLTVCLETQIPIPALAPDITAERLSERLEYFLDRARHDHLAAVCFNTNRSTEIGMYRHTGPPPRVRR